MKKDNNLQQWKERFNQSCFFSTQVSSLSNIDKDSPKSNNNLFRISSRFKDEPKVLLKKAKEQKKEASNKHLEVLRTNLKMRSCVHKAEKDASLCRHQFIKLYHNKKFKLEENAVMSEHKIDNERYFRTSVQNFKKKKWMNQMSVSIRKEDKQRRIEELQQNNQEYEKQFRKTFRATSQKIRKQIQNSHQKVKQEEIGFYYRKRNLHDLASTKSKFNYMSKVNDEMMKIKECQDRLRDLEDNDSNPQNQSVSRGLPNIFTTTFTHRWN